MKRIIYYFLTLSIVANLTSPLYAQLAITSPSPSGEYFEGGNIQVEAATTDNSIKKVRFFAGETLLGEDGEAPFTSIWPNVWAGKYALIAQGIDANGTVIISTFINVTVQTGCTGFGSISHQIFYKLGGARVPALTDNPRFPDTPSYISKRPMFEGDTNVADSFGVRMYGYICPPITGDYTFYISADDRADLYLSTNDKAANKVLIAYAKEPTGFREYTKYPEQESAPIRLVKATKYYVEAIHKEDSKSDHVSVAWRMPNGSFENPIPGSRLWPVFKPTGLPDEISFSGTSEISIYPIPTKEDVNVKFHTYHTGRAELLLSDAFSNTVMVSYAETVPGQNTVNFALPPLATGIYMLRITAGNETKSIKLPIVK